MKRAASAACSLAMLIGCAPPERPASPNSNELEAAQALVVKTIHEHNSGLPLTTLSGSAAQWHKETFAELERGHVQPTEIVQYGNRLIIARLHIEHPLDTFSGWAGLEIEGGKITFGAWTIYPPDGYSNVYASQIADGASQQAIFALGGFEANPVMGVVTDTAGVPGMIAVKVAATHWVKKDFSRCMNGYPGLVGFGNFGAVNNVGQALLYSAFGGTVGLAAIPVAFAVTMATWPGISQTFWKCVPKHYVEMQFAENRDQDHVSNP